MALTQFPPDLATPANGLRQQYQRYLAIEKASEHMATLRRSGAWPYGANKDSIISLCVSSSSFYDYWNKPFGQVKNYPRMVAWLSDAPDAESDEDIWGKREQNLT